MNTRQRLPAVIVPTFSDVERLATCLAALAAQTCADYEIIVVDNSPGDEDTRALCARFPRVTYVCEPVPGSYAARNRGVRVAQGSVLAFTDSDCVPETSWLENGLAHLQHLDADVVGGRIDVVASPPEARTLTEWHDVLFAFQQDVTIAQDGYAATANLMTWRATYDEVGGFDASRKSGGDAEWCQRATAVGKQLAYADDAVVAHPARTSTRELFRKSRRIAGGNYDGLESRGARALKVLRYLLPPWRPTLQLFRAPRLGFYLRMRLFGLLHAKNLVMAVEMLRLMTGGKSARS